MRGGKRRCGIIKNGWLRSRIRIKIKLRIRVIQKFIRHIAKQNKQASINKLFKSISEIGVKFHREIFHCEEFHCQEFHCEEFHCEEFQFVWLCTYIIYFTYLEIFYFHRIYLYYPQSNSRHRNISHYHNYYYLYLL